MYLYFLFLYHLKKQKCLGFSLKHSEFLYEKKDTGCQHVSTINDAKHYGHESLTS